MLNVKIWNIALSWKSNAVGGFEASRGSVFLCSNANSPQRLNAWPRSRMPPAQPPHALLAPVRVPNRKMSADRVWRMRTRLYARTIFIFKVTEKDFSTYGDYGDNTLQRRDLSGHSRSIKVKRIIPRPAVNASSSTEQ